MDNETGMIQMIAHISMRDHVGRARQGRVGKAWRGLLMTALLVVNLSACSTFFVSAYDQKSVDRTTEISKNIFALYQEIISLEPAQRAAAITGPLKSKQGDIETQIRVQLLLEQARDKNHDSVVILTKLLESWTTFSAHHAAADTTALSNATLGVERNILSRELRSALVAEEAKKLGRSPDTASDDAGK